MSAIRFSAALTAAFLSLSAVAPMANAEDHAEAMHVHDAYARLGAMSGGVFFMIHNNTATDDRLVGARTDLARKVELHTHKEDAAGVMAMVEIEGGVALPSGEMHAFERGGDHVMLMGLTAELKDGDVIPLTLVFESGAEVALEVPVDNVRKPGAGMMDHSGHMSGGMGHDMSHGMSGN